MEPRNTGFVTMSVDRPLVASAGAAEASTPGGFSATQGLSTARLNATVGLTGHGPLPRRLLHFLYRKCND